eukprot:TRINITY_DN1508_c0_g1_i3.p1 TRINITY_DN1508_c0_g1~~TRINITY_DN1508_c0_g1_i3.p1  ORF type:complete len:232 (-),score=36.21 TRINITY_DN1508_c0_g1_i3:110-805(-)
MCIRDRDDAAKLLKMNSLRILTSSLLQKKPAPYENVVIVGKEFTILDTDLFSDIHFIFGGDEPDDEAKVLFAHRAVLYHRCNYFRDMFHGDLHSASIEKVHVTHASYPAFRAVLNFIYSDRLDFALGGTLLSEVFYLAHMYELNRLLSHCEEKLAELMSVSNFVDLWFLATSHESSSLVAHSEWFFSFYENDIIKTKHFKQLSLEQKTLLQNAKKKITGSDGKNKYASIHW